MSGLSVAKTENKFYYEGFHRCWVDGEPVTGPNRGVRVVGLGYIVWVDQYSGLVGVELNCESKVMVFLMRSIIWGL